MPRVLKSVQEANMLKNRHCSLVSKAADALPFATHLTKFSRRAVYDAKEKLETNVHLGQRKLLMSEIQFLTLYFKNNPDGRPVVVYVGAAGGKGVKSHLMFLSSLFPKVSFILYDGGDFDPRLNEIPLKFELHNVFFTDATCVELKKRFAAVKRDLLFISDIRLGGDSHTKFEKQVERDNALQLGWVKILKPKYSMLKFRLPYSLKHGDAINYNKGKVMLQMWPPQTSGETRLLITRADIGKSEKYDFKTYEQSLFFHNKWSRRYCFDVDRVFDDAKDREAVNSLLYADNNVYCKCYDCMAELYTLKGYVDLFGKITLQKLVDRVTIEMKRIPFAKEAPDLFTI